ncbi:MAG: helix-turn-helix domain-containing protein [Treponema sp.]|nr:helix-turn-helix domain-containing protein [Treponema sp.]
MGELVFESSLSNEEIADNFKNISFFDGLMQGLNEALAYEKGNARAETYSRKQNLPEVNVAKERASLNMTQKAFAALIGVSKRTVEAWECGKCTPSPTARKLIHLLSVEPSLVEKL